MLARLIEKFKQFIDRHKNIIRIVVLLLMLDVLALGVYLVLETRAYDNQALFTSCIIELSCMLFTVLLYVFCRFGDDGYTYKNGLFSVLVSAVMPLIFCDLFITLYSGNGGVKDYLMTAQTVAYVFTGLEWMMFVLFAAETVDKKPAGESNIMLVQVMLVTAFCALPVVNIFTGLLFKVNQAGIIKYTALQFSFDGGGMGAYRGLTVLDMITAIMIVIELLYIILSKCNAVKRIIILLCTLMPGALIASKVVWAQNSGYVLKSVNSLFYVFMLYLMFFGVYTEERAQFLRQREETTEMKTSMMLSQIQPHFIYNSLTAILGLIDIDKEQAKESIVSFSDYLRVNLDSLKEVRMIPFEKELEHCQTYLGFELLRFDRISVEYDLQYTDFFVPVLTVQPIVENAIKHGISAKAEGGTLRLSTAIVGNKAVITVQDDGMGFDSTVQKPGVHVGVSNVRKRLKDMCGGDLTIESQVGKGTVSTITVPLKYEK